MHWIVGAVLSICVFSGAANGQAKELNRPDTSRYAALKYDSSIDMAMDERFYEPKPTNLSKAEVDSIEIIVDSAYRGYNEQNPHRQLMGTLWGFPRQYVAVIDGNGRKKVWINFFCARANPDWKHHVVIVDDGGVCYFQMMIDMTQGRVMWVIANGSA